MAATATRGADVARCWAGFASLGAGLVHAAVIEEHWAAWPAYGVFFAVVALGQLGWGLAALAGEHAPFARAVVAANLGIVVLWTVTRTTGLPFGPDAGSPEGVGAADLGSVVLELLVAVGVLVSRRRAARAALTGRSRAAVLGGLAVGALAVSLITTPALAATSAGEHAHPHGSHATGR